MRKFLKADTRSSAGISFRMVQKKSRQKRRTPRR
jgi:hypothetical protein